uniref:EF-hand domain-containing protein n=1 Tax=Heterosigma akashiwo TaxID=2829 RepID=A0A6V2ZWM5_HETAK|mmetsp:Transcript_35716/g.56103  ORF Transcript_35716/g.56103 Transcript_35716/m.56103 type:complete len:213 (-) Transcript_35716:486-1124(-)|eukprot:CAMPEP_0194578548 /NCGR_PEP_ID=MMETSP0292-20121207/12923_1 /TAXON_ID=39354 /ORGANISM="Heterosigma akashiwo, Strain CCMP2393" /LENGTH=212 /DNA_ID=CAMNT_0039431227 /DNA_START=80 /DNA_END=718 /DNA_ORIENTATION=+
MGNRGSLDTSVTLPAEDAQRYADSTHFTVDEVKALYIFFSSIAASNEDDGLIDRREFQQALGFKDSVFLDRMFAVFDKDGDGMITYSEFVAGLSIFTTKAPAEEKLRFSFNVYDFDGDGAIATAELREMLRATVYETDTLVVPEDQLEALVEATMVQANPATPGRISFEEYVNMVANHPNMLSQMTINISSIIMENIGGLNLNSPAPPAAAS